MATEKEINDVLHLLYKSCRCDFKDCVCSKAVTIIEALAAPISRAEIEEADDFILGRSAVRGFHDARLRSIEL